MHGCAHARVRLRPYIHDGIGVETCVDVVVMLLCCDVECLRPFGILSTTTSGCSTFALFRVGQQVAFQGIAAVYAVLQVHSSYIELQYTQ